jgi:uncharacterized phage protein (TIGR01671 family)
MKFRVWSDRENRYIYSDEMRCFYEFFEQYCQDEDECEQWTGAHDKNNKEIYEGDIVKVARSHQTTRETSPGIFTIDQHEDGIEVGVVMWAVFSYKHLISYEHLRYDDLEDFNGISHRHEVIGNVKENPELLEKKR